MLTCKQASRLASKGLDAKLNIRERLALWGHLVLCKLCRHYRHDLRWLRRGLQHAEHKDQLLPDSIKLSEQSRQRIADRLRRNSEHSDSHS